MSDSSGLPTTWVAARFGLDPIGVNALRRAGELIAFRTAGGTDWTYPAWQFDASGVKPSIARFLAVAREEGVRSADVEELLDRRVGLVGGSSVLELLLAGKTDGAIAAIPEAAAELR